MATKKAPAKKAAKAKRADTYVAGDEHDGRTVRAVSRQGRDIVLHYEGGGSCRAPHMIDI